jgi:hypothetical protein
MNSAMFLLSWWIAPRKSDAIPAAITKATKTLAPEDRPFHECALVDIRPQMAEFRDAASAPARELPLHQG